MAEGLTDGRKRRAIARRARTEARLLQAAETVIVRKGFHAATIADIVEEADVARGTFYQYFDSREAVFRRLIGDFVAVLNGSVRRVTEPASPVDDVRRNVHQVLLQLFAHRDLAVLLFRDALTPDPALERLQRELHDHMHRMVQGALRRGAEWGLLRPVDADGTAWTIIGAIKELLLRRLDAVADENQAEVDSETAVDDEFPAAVRRAADEAASVLVDAFYGGLRAV